MRCRLFKFRFAVLFLPFLSLSTFAQTTDISKTKDIAVGQKPARGYGDTTKNTGRLTPGYGNAIGGYGPNVSGTTPNKRCNGRLMSAYDRNCVE